ncbi:MAG: helix-turn-helix domain-containing protein [Pelagimonas sp.]|jgi:transcriptional regulator with XRE-family HTH domain|nr:helix-turn-helix domain-containing protein [Pelagimonas sp.]
MSSSSNPDARHATNDVFAANLKLLCALRPSIAQVGRDLDISKVQMARFLNGTSFPKPVVLKRICDYFHVDARILLDPIPPEDLDFIATLQKSSGPLASILRTRRDPWTEAALSFATENRHDVDTTDMIQDGLYVIWRQSYARPGAYCAIPVSFKTLGKLRIYRGYDARELYRNTPAFHQPHRREFRGFVFGGAFGLAALSFGSMESSFVNVAFFDKPAMLKQSAVSGFIVAQSLERQGFRRHSNLVLDPVGPEFADLLRLARAPTYYDLNDLPEYVRYHVEHK